MHNRNNKNIINNEHSAIKDENNVYDGSDAIMNHAVIYNVICTVIEIAMTIK